MQPTSLHKPLHHKVTSFGLTLALDWSQLSTPIDACIDVFCDSQQFYFAIPGVVRFLVMPQDNRIVIEKAHHTIDDNVIETWLLGTVFAYVLQYHGYLVLHGAAVMLNNKAIIISGQSGAGKSTLAMAMLKHGAQLITDDLVVIKKHPVHNYVIIPGPAKLKLWKDVMQHFDHNINDAYPVMLRTDKYAIPVTEVCHEAEIPINAFYELNIALHDEQFNCDKLNQAQALKTLIQNTYRYFMLKPLGKLQTFLQDCSALSQHISVYKITRSTCLDDLAQLSRYIYLN